MAFCELHYFSNSLEKQACAWCILPETAAPFSVLYLLHGSSDDHTIWCRRTSIERYAAQWPSLMIVMPDGGRGFYCDAVQGDAYQSALIDDLIPSLDRVFQTRAERAGRAIGGLSMGGYGAVKLALQFPDLFASAHSHSGAFEFGHSWKADLPEFSRILGDEAKGGGRNDVYRLAQECRQPPPIWIDCGTNDVLLEQSRSFHAHLDNLKIDHEYHEFPGNHEWAYWDLHIQEALAFHGRNLGLTPQV